MTGLIIVPNNLPSGYEDDLTNYFITGIMLICVPMLLWTIIDLLRQILEINRRDR